MNETETSELIVSHPPTHRRTKIVCTIGPASRSSERIAELLQAGANVFRLNFSHGSHDEHFEVLGRIRSESDRLRIPVAVLQDLSGPKIRITEVDEADLLLVDGGTVELHPSVKERSNSSHIYVEGLDPTAVLKSGQLVLLADGMLALECVSVSANAAQCRVLKGGKMRSRIGIAFPDSIVNLPAATEKDLVDLAWGIKNGVDFVAVSFVQNADDIRRVREEIKRLGGKASIVAKIERKLAVTNIDEIIAVTDAVMVARGDLGLELPLEKVPRVQKRLIERSNAMGKPVIVATQMLHSMVNSMRPTRAEVSDTATAVMDGADAVMLSEETAIGSFPIESVQYLNRIALESERTFQFEEYKLRLRDADLLTVPDAVAYAACAASLKVNAAAIIACTETGTSARLVAKYRPQQPLYGATRSQPTLRKLCLYWGVRPILFPATQSHDDEILEALEKVQQFEDIAGGSRAVITGGLAVGTPGSTSVLEIREFK